jgi:hypothetical protein
MQRETIEGTHNYQGIIKLLKANSKEKNVLRRKRDPEWNKRMIPNFLSETIKARRKCSSIFIGLKEKKTS